MSPAHRQMDQSPPSRLGEGDPARSLRSGLLPAALGELSEPSPPPSAGRGACLARSPGPGRSRALPPAVAGCEPPTDPSRAVRAGQPASKEAVREPGHRGLPPAPGERSGEGVSRRAATPGSEGPKGAGGAWVKFSSSPWKAHA